MKTFTFLLLGLIFVLQTMAQTPQAFKYQSVARDASGTALSNKTVSFRISILSGNASGPEVYKETHTGKMTNSFGLAELEIGKGTPVTGTFSAISWSTNNYFVKIELDPLGGSSFINMGTSQLLSVPYALVSKTAENVNDADADPVNEIQAITISGTQLTLSKGGGTVTLPSSGGGDNWGTQSVVTDASLSGNGSTTTPLKLASQGAVNGQFLKWNGTSWVPGSGSSGSSGWTLSGTNLINENNTGQVTINSSSSLPLRIDGGSNLYAGLYESGVFRGYLGSYSGDAADVDFGTGIGTTGKTHLVTNATPRLTVDNTGNVGIGITSPFTKLHVGGSITIADGSEGKYKVLTSDAFGKGKWESLPTEAWAKTATGILYTGGEVQIAPNPSVATPFTIYNNSLTSYMNIKDNAGSGIRIGTYVGELAVFNDNQDKDIFFRTLNSSGYNDRIRIKGASGFVSIGSQSPTTKLDVDGQVRIRGGNPAAGKVLTSGVDGTATWETSSSGSSNWTVTGTTLNNNNSSGTVHIKSTSSEPARIEGGASSYLSFYESGVYRGYMGSYSGSSNDMDFGTGAGSSGKTHLVTNASPRLTVDASGRIGIGTTTPIDNLTIKDATTDCFMNLLNSTTGLNGFRFGISGTDAVINNYETGKLSFGTSGAYRMTILSNGNVGIGTGILINPAYKLDVNGDIRATGSVFYGGTAWAANGNAYTKPDFVFEEEYKELSTEKIEDFILREKHLPWVTSARKEYEENKGAVDMTRMAFETLEAVENLQLQIIKQDKVINELTKENEELRKLHQDIEKRIDKIEKRIKNK